MSGKSGRANAKASDVEARVVAAVESHLAKGGRLARGVFIDVQTMAVCPLVALSGTVTENGFPIPPPGLRNGMRSLARCLGCGVEDLWSIVKGWENVTDRGEWWEVGARLRARYGYGAILSQNGADK